MIAIEHMADEPEGLIQRCSRCGEIIIDNRNVMIAENPQHDYSPHFWKAGPVYQCGTAWSIVQFGNDRSCIPN